MPSAGSPTRAPLRSLLRPAAAWVRDRSAVVACGGAATLAFGALLLPGSASAQTVRPAALGSAPPGSAAAPVAHPVRPEPPALVQVAAPAAPVARQVAAPPPEAVAPAPGAPLAAPAPPPPPAAPPAPAPAPPAAPSWYSPAPGAPMSNPYGTENSEYLAGYHTGVDFAVDSGTPLRAVAAATVVSAGWGGAYGQEVVLQLPDGYYAEYAHLSELAVGPGEDVTAGQQIGRSGSTGHSTGPHLHFEIRSANQYGAVTDPIAYLSARGVSDF
ncbi:hypothetical protein CFP65_3208 [Kitasatospora sp. MMS16-BH015]|uniref:M23 family metallopeptidase n=1 Tax=Kitasatospora sp. MMS16-BH015 TaxID=2018025 RepID=UPI000CA18ABB|nr:M23 family metallopeptidase [Kitasatospora sp. MMS16-BH015]AUG78012.1 hypothetical protein CFP65_3208 [Kitasatospora sp. MMS16-BH015]